MKIIIMMLIALSFVSCNNTHTSDEVSGGKKIVKIGETVGYSRNVSRIEDPEKSVSCYVLEGASSVAISCLKDETAQK